MITAPPLCDLSCDLHPAPPGAHTRLESILFEDEQTRIVEEMTIIQLYLLNLHQRVRKNIKKLYYFLYIYVQKSQPIYDWAQQVL